MVLTGAQAHRFALIELVAVVAMLAILATVAIPRRIDLNDGARELSWRRPISP